MAYNLNNCTPQCATIVALLFFSYYCVPIFGASYFRGVRGGDDSKADLSGAALYPYDTYSNYSRQRSQLNDKEISPNQRDPRWNDRKESLDLIKQHPNLFSMVSPELRLDAKFVEAAIHATKGKVIDDDGTFVTLFKRGKVIVNKNVAKAIVLYIPPLIHSTLIAEDFLKDPEFIEECLRANYLGEGIEGSPYNDALLGPPVDSNNKFIFDYAKEKAEEKVKNDQKLFLDLIDRHGFGMSWYASDKLKKNAAFIEKVLRKIPEERLESAKQRFKYLNIPRR